IDQLLPFCNNLLRTCAHMSDSSSELCHFSRKPVTDLQHFFVKPNACDDVKRSSPRPFDHVTDFNKAPPEGVLRNAIARVGR
ncbi:MAG: hypothetical protein ACFCUG_03660, partial [Thiotrichales bacterium]